MGRQNLFWVHRSTEGMILQSHLSDTIQHSLSLSLSFLVMQRLASDFLYNYIFLAVGRVGSSTDLIVQRVEFVHESDKRSHLMDLLHAQRANGVQGRVTRFFFFALSTFVSSLP